jgi:protein OS-9
VSKQAFLLCFGFQIAAARLLHSLPEDTYAFPKYRVSFLNGLPVLRETAERWLQDGLRGGELEFLNQPWSDVNVRAPSSLKGIGSGDSKEDGEPFPTKASNITLEYMKMGPDDSYICLIPPPLENSTPALEEQEEDVTPVQSWSLLQPLSGTCLYHRQPWFTYSYCHNQEIRQFRELAQTHLNPSGGYEPMEDHDWESYILGRAPPVPEPGVDLTTAQETALAANLELARGAGSRYLVQRWGDGTMCDKTGKHREVEVQFHCSMTVTDTILLVREAKTCSYVLVIHTPRLCGQPGFKSRLETRDQAYIRCREVVDSIDATTQADGVATQSDRPSNKMSQRKPLLAVPAQRPPADAKAADTASAKDKAQAYNDRLDSLRKALETMLGHKDGDGDDEPQVFVEQIDLGDGAEDLMFEIAFDERVLERHPDQRADFAGARQSLVEMLRSAGFDVKGEKNGEEKKAKKEEKRTDDGGDPPQGREEL